jgi:hypothetical protein
MDASLDPCGDSKRNYMVSADHSRCDTVHTHHQCTDNNKTHRLGEINADWKRFNETFVINNVILHPKWVI